MSLQSVFLGMDAPEGFTAAVARDMAADGRMTAGVTSGRPITGAGHSLGTTTRTANDR